MRQSDDRARQILDRTESMPEEQFMKLARRVARPDPGEGGAAMNEWEWNLLEDKSHRRSHRDGGILSKPVIACVCGPRRAATYSTSRCADKSQSSKASKRTMKARSTSAWFLKRIRGVILDCCASRAIVSFSRPRKSNLISKRADGESPGRASVLPKKANILIAGIGNIFLGDDGFGVEVVRRLAGSRFARKECVVDFGIRGFDLAYALQDGYETTILVDAYPHGEARNGSVVEPDLKEIATQVGLGSAPRHEPIERAAHGQGNERFVNRVLLVGCEPLDLGGEEGHMGLSAVEAAVKMP